MIILVYYQMIHPEEQFIENRRIRMNKREVNYLVVIICIISMLILIFTGILLGIVKVY